MELAIPQHHTYEYRTAALLRLTARTYETLWRVPVVDQVRRKTLSPKRGPTDAKAASWGLQRDANRPARPERQLYLRE